MYVEDINPKEIKSPGGVDQQQDLTSSSSSLSKNDGITEVEDCQSSLEHCASNDINHFSINKEKEQKECKTKEDNKTLTTINDFQNKTEEVNDAFVKNSLSISSVFNDDILNIVKGDKETCESTQRESEQLKGEKTILSMLLILNVMVFRYLTKQIFLILKTVKSLQKLT